MVDALVQLHMLALKSECGLIDTMENRKEHLYLLVPQAQLLRFVL